MDAILSRVLPVERIVARSSILCAGLFRCGVDHPLFPGGDPCSSFCVVFPRAAAWIEHEGERRFVADPSMATLYNQGQVYRRWSIGNRADRCDWLAFPVSVIRDAVAIWSPADAEHQTRPLRHGFARIDAPLYARQRALFDRLERGTAEDLTTVEERALGLLHAVLGHAYGDEASRRDSRPSRRTFESIEHARQLIAGRPDERASLVDLARAVEISPFHLCREFSAVTGTTISAYRTGLRLRASLERVVAGEDLTSVALSLGFVSHSHFTQAFRRAFGKTPSAMRRSVAGYQ